MMGVAFISLEWQLGAAPLARDPPRLRRSEAVMGEHSTWIVH